MNSFSKRQISTIPYIKTKQLKTYKKTGEVGVLEEYANPCRHIALYMLPIFSTHATITSFVNVSI